VSFEDDIKAELEAPKRTLDVTVKLNGNSHTFRVERMDPGEWVSATAACPADLSLPFDRAYGYNLEELTRIVIPRTAKRVDGDDLVDVSAEAWDAIFAKVSGGTFGRFSDAIFNLNEFDDQQQVADLKKALAGAAVQSSRSRSNSGSRTAGSSGGSRSE
jgi:hypothetical protein